jgi:hypothetical protein
MTKNGRLSSSSSSRTGSTGDFNKGFMINGVLNSLFVIGDAIGGVLTGSLAFTLPISTGMHVNTATFNSSISMKRRGNAFSFYNSRCFFSEEYRNTSF